MYYDKAMLNSYIKLDVLLFQDNFKCTHDDERVHSCRNWGAEGALASSILGIMYYIMLNLYSLVSPPPPPPNPVYVPTLLPSFT